MSVRRGPAIVLSSVLGAAALVLAPPAQASDGGAAKAITSQKSSENDARAQVTKKECRADSVVKIRVVSRNNGRLEAIGTVWSDDSDVWEWKLRHEGDLSDEGVVQAKDADKSFKIVRSMIDFVGIDTVTFRAENRNSGEVCRATTQY